MRTTKILLNEKNLDTSDCESVFCIQKAHIEIFAPHRSMLTKEYGIPSPVLTDIDYKFLEYTGYIDKLEKIINQFYKKNDKKLKN